MAMPNNNPASGPTLKWLHDLIVGKDEQGISDMVDKMPPDWEALFRRVVAGFAALDADNLGPETLNVWFAFEEVPALCQSDAGRFIDQLKLLPWASKTQSGEPVAEVTEDGIYRTKGKIFKVYWNREQTRLLAKELVIIDRPESGPAKVRFDYVGLAARFVKAGDRMPYEEAKEFGALYGICVYGHPLTDEVSIHLGIGPVCGDRQFGGDFEFMVDQARLELGMKPRRKKVSK